MKISQYNIRALTLFMFLFAVQFLHAQTGIVMINRSMGDMNTSKELKDRDQYFSHTFVAYVENGVVQRVAGWGEGVDATSMLAGHWVTDSIADYSVAQDAIRNGLYTLAVAGGDLNLFNAELLVVQDGWSHPNLGFLFNCKWAAWVLANNYSLARSGFVWTGVSNVQPIDTLEDQWMDEHLHPAYWMALQASVGDPFALSNYENTIAAKILTQNPQSGKSVEI